MIQTIKLNNLLKNDFPTNNNNNNNNLVEKKINKNMLNDNNKFLNKSDEMFQLAKKIKYNDHYNTFEGNKEAIITYKISAITKNELQGISNKSNKSKNYNSINTDNNLNDIIKSIEINNFKRVQKVINANEKTKTTNIINVSKTNNSESINLNKENNSFMISPIKKDIINTSINKIDNKQIHIKGRKNHNYISIINITNNAPIQKNEENEEKSNDIFDVM